MTTDTLHAAIMNLPCSNPHSEDHCRLYDQGHRDARHAAAELVSANGDDAIEAIQEWHERLENVVAANQIPMPEHITVQALKEITRQMRDEMGALLVKIGAQP